MMQNKTALFIGRFQPLHKGHLFVLKNLLKKYKKVIIGIGSINKCNENNIFSFRQRKEMLNRVLKKYKNYKIIGIPDFGSNKKWAKYVNSRAKFDVVFTGNKIVRSCLNDHAVLRQKFYKRNIYSSTKIRKLINSGRWKKFVPKEIHDIVEKKFHNT